MCAQLASGSWATPRLSRCRLNGLQKLMPLQAQCDARGARALRALHGATTTERRHRERSCRQHQDTWKGVVTKWNDLESSFEEEWNRDLHDQPFQFWVLDTQLLPLPIVRLVAQFRYSEKPIPPAIEEKIESITHKYGLESRWDLAFYLGSWKSFTYRRTLEAILAFRKSNPDTCLRDLLRAAYKIRDDRLRSNGKGAEKSLFSFSPSDVIGRSILPK